MKKKIIKKNNHLYPDFHIKKWREKNGLCFNKKTNDTSIIPDLLFSEEYYYSLGKINDDLENRISLFEGYIGKLIKKIDESNKSVFFTAKETEILKLYCVLAASRHHMTTEVIKNDESDFYKSNNYLIGIKNISLQQEAVAFTEKIIDDFERLLVLPEDQEFLLDYRVLLYNGVNIPYTQGMHISIVRSQSSQIMTSSVFNIIENTMDGDHLYTYIPISPDSALMLVKTKYYLDEEVYNESLDRLSKKYNAITPDEYISVILGDFIDKNSNHEKVLFCSYYKYKSNVHINDNVYLKSLKYTNSFIKINVLPDYIFDQYNRIFYEDGENILFINRNDLERVKKINLNYRTITLNY